MIKKIFISYLLVLCVSNSSMKADNEGILAVLAAIGITKIASEIATIELLTKATPNAAGIQAGTEITSDLINSAAATLVIGGLGDELWGKIKNNQTLSFEDKTLFPFAIASGIALLGSSTYHINQFRALLKNKKAIARYRKDPQIQAFLAKIKSKQRRWFAANYLLPIAIVIPVLIGLDKAYERDYIKSTGTRNAMQFGSFALCAIAAYISEQIRTARLFKAANATAKKPLDIPVVEEEEEEEEETEEDESDDKAQEESSNVDETDTK